MARDEKYCINIFRTSLHLNLNYNDCIPVYPFPVELQGMHCDPTQDALNVRTQHQLPKILLAFFSLTEIKILQ